MSTADDVARWMLSEVINNEILYQESATFDIEKLFGHAFLYENEAGNVAINKDVLKAFKKLSEDTVVWERGEKAWRLREEHDAPGRLQD